MREMDRKSVLKDYQDEEITNYFFTKFYVTAPVNCGDPGLPENGHRVVEGTTESSEVEYFCVRGYALIGPMTRTCTSTGEWSGRLPVCQSMFYTSMGGHVWSNILPPSYCIVQW